MIGWRNELQQRTFPARNKKRWFPDRQHRPTCATPRYKGARSFSLRKKRSEHTPQSRVSAFFRAAHGLGPYLTNQVLRNHPHAVPAAGCTGQRRSPGGVQQQRAVPGRFTSGNPRGPGSPRPLPGGTGRTLANRRGCGISASLIKLQTGRF